MESCIWNPESDTLTPPILVSVEILTKTLEVDNNACDESHEAGCNERVQVANLGPEKKA